MAGEKRHITGKHLKRAPAVQAQGDEKQAFEDKVYQIILDSINAVILNQEYNKNFVESWNSNIVSRCKESLLDLKKSYKFIVTCEIFKKKEEALYLATGHFWDCITDHTCTLKWLGIDLYCFVSVFSIAI